MIIVYHDYWLGGYQMTIDLKKTQDVYKDAGDNIIFVTSNLNRENRSSDLAAIQNLAEKLPALENSLNIRYPKDGLAVAFGFSRNAWDYLFPSAPVPKQLEEFKEIKGPKYTAPATPADLFFHIRATNSAMPYELLAQIMTLIQDNTTVVDETHGFRYFEGRAIIGFVDGTENPSALDTPDYAVIGDEDPEYINGSYAFAQKYLHDMGKWNKQTTEQQEKVIGRKKFNDMELDDEEKDPNAHNLASKDERDGVEHKIVRMNVPFADASENVHGTYFIGYAREWFITKNMLNNMFSKSDRLLDFSTPITGEVFFIPSRDILEKIADDEM